MEQHTVLRFHFLPHLLYFFTYDFRQCEYLLHYFLYGHCSAITETEWNAVYICRATSEASNTTKMGCMHFVMGTSFISLENLSMSICDCKSESRTPDWTLFLLIEEALVIIFGQSWSVDNIWNASLKSHLRQFWWWNSSKENVRVRETHTATS